jgi:adenylosuccinate synthase
MQAFIVLGLGFGDEGKGVTTDFLASSLPKPIVVRFSGGHQAGHTVIYGDRKHIHSSFGSGTLRGTPSYFSEHTCFYLPNMANEWYVLASKGVEPKLVLHPLAKMTTHFDVAFNRVREKRIGHGSCGLGISATEARHREGLQIFAIDLQHKKILKQKIAGVVDYYRLRLNDDDMKAFVDEANALQPFFFKLIEDEVWKKMFSVASYRYLYDYDSLIFEGSQGILLDKDHGIFPNVTYANTTSKNAIEICRKVNPIMARSFYYVTRCYQTRHGAGWMSNEQNLELINTENEINVHNEWQKDFRIGELDYDLINQALQYDYIYSERRGGLRNLVITCLDQRPGWTFDIESLSDFQFDDIFLNDSPRAGNMVRYSEGKTLMERVVTLE